MNLQPLQMNLPLLLMNPLRSLMNQQPLQKSPLLSLNFQQLLLMNLLLLQMNLLQSLKNLLRLLMSQLPLLKNLLLSLNFQPL